MNLKISSTNSVISCKSTTSLIKSDNSQNIRSNLEKSPAADTFEMSVGYINDTHGQTNNMMRILSGIRGDLRLSAGDNDIGDEKNKPVHKVTYKFLNLAGIKATALGNHELDANQEDLIDSLKYFNGEVLVSNIKKDMIEKQDAKVVKRLGRAHLEDSWKGSSIIEVKGEKIGLIGASPIDLIDRLTHPEYHTDCHVDKIEDTIEDIQGEVNKLKEQGVNKIILLSHLGNKHDKIVAQNVEGVDVIIGGHTHELIKGITEGENLLYSKTGEPVIITEAGRDGNYFGELNLTFNKDGVITRAQNNLGDTGKYHRNMINQYVFNSILGTPEEVGYIKQAPLPPKSLIEENPHANFVCDVMKEKSDSDIAIWHNCGVRNFFHEGSINTRDIKDISPFLDYVAVADVSEKTIVDMFKKAIKDTYASSARKPGLFAVSGLDYAVDAQNGTLVGMNFYDKAGNKHAIDVNNPDETKKYRVVTDEFLMSAGADFNVLAPEADYVKKYPYDKDVMTAEYIKEQKKPIYINQLGRIKFV